MIKMNENTLNNVAKTLNVTVDTLRTKALTVLEEQAPAWRNANKSEEDCGLLAIRVAARSISTENARMTRSGASKYEGMFISSPRTKEWGKILYNKMKNQLLTASPEVIQTLVDSGAVVTFEDNHDGSYTRSAREDFYGQEVADVTELPAHTMKLNENLHFFVVWDKANKTFPSGDVNFKFGRPRPQDERERTSMFFGRPEGASSPMQLISVKAQGKAADVQHPTFVTGTIPLRTGKNNNAYAKPDITILTPKLDVANSFTQPPISISDDGMSSGLIIDILRLENTLGSLAELPEYYNTFNGTQGWWDRQLCVATEVIHIDPREAGGFVLVCADLDIASTAPTVDVYVSADQEFKVDFAVGTKALLVGQTWRTQDGEQRLSINGWWAFDEIEAMSGDGY